MGRIKKSQLVFLTFVVIVFVFLFLNASDVRQSREIVYNDAIAEISSGNYQDAIDSLSPIYEFKDSQKHILYSEAMLLFKNGSYREAQELFSQLNGFLESDSYMEQCAKLQIEADNKQAADQTAYDSANTAFENQNYIEALEIFEKLGNYENSQEMAQICKSLIKMRSQANTISAGIRYSAAVTAAGTAYFSGKNFFGEDDIRTWTDIVSICAKGRIVIGLKNDGTVVTAGNAGDYRIDTSMWHDIVAVAAGQQYIVGLRADGTLTAQGHNGDGQTNIDSWTNIISIACGWRHTVGLDSSGKIHIAGYDSESQLEQIERDASEWTNIVAISAGGGSKEYGKQGHTVALRRDGTAVAVGDNSHGQCNVQGEDWTNLIAVSAGDDHTVGLRADGTVVTTQKVKSSADAGANIQDWKNVVAVSAGYGFTIAIVETQTDDGKVHCIVVGDGNDHEGQRDTEDWSDIAEYKAEWDLLFDKNYVSTYFSPGQ